MLRFLWFTHRCAFKHFGGLKTIVLNRKFSTAVDKFFFLGRTKKFFVSFFQIFQILKEKVAPKILSKLFIKVMPVMFDYRYHKSTRKVIRRFRWEKNDCNQNNNLIKNFNN